MKRLAVALCLTAAALPARADYFLYAGSYTAGTSKGIYAWRFNEKDGALTSLGLVAETPQPAHVWITPNGKYLYTVNWETAGGVSAYAINARTGALTFLNKVSSHGAQPNQVVVDPSGRVAVTVNYTTGTVAAYKLEPDGKLGEAFWVGHHTGKPLSEKQPGPKAHGIQFSKDNKFMFIAELGLDRVYSYRFDAAKPEVTPSDPPFISTHAGAGPRRLQLSPDGKFLYVDHETDSEVSVFAVDGGNLKEIQTIGTIPAGTTVRNSTAEIVIDAAGRYLYVSNRGHDSIAVFAIDRATGKLTLKENVPSGGRTPRNLRIDPTGNWFFSANENGGNLTEFKINKASGHLTATGVTAPIDTPGGMYFVKAR